jgi:hypothetical protein
LLRFVSFCFIFVCRLRNKSDIQEEEEEEEVEAGGQDVARADLFHRLLTLKRLMDSKFLVFLIPTSDSSGYSGHRVYLTPHLLIKHTPIVLVVVLKPLL